MRVFLGIGSNVHPEKHIDQTIQLLCDIYGKLEYSQRYNTAAMGFEGPDFINMVVAFETKQNVAEITIETQRIERSVGRIRERESSTGSRAIDIDLLLFEGTENGGELLPEPRSDIKEFAYAAVPLADLNPEWKHPLIGDQTLEGYLESNPFSEQKLEIIS